MQEEVAVVEIDLGNGHTDEISVQKGDSLALLAEAFCAKHNLTPNVKVSIEAYLAETLKGINPKPQKKLRKTGKTNVGSRLYKTGVELKRKREQRSEQLKQAQEEAELANFSFQPKIIQMPTLPSQVRLTPNKPKRIQVMNLFKECTFSPKIDEHSRKIAVNRQHSAASLRLYQESEVILEHKMRLTEELEGFRTQRKPLSMEDSIKRLHTGQTHNRKMVSSLANSISELTFTPRRGKSPKNVVSTNVVERLYSSKSPLEKKSVLSPPKINPKSNALAEKIRISKFKALFEELRPVNGVISPETITNVQIDGELKKIIAPILEEIKESDEQLTSEEFCGALLALFKVLTPLEKHKVLEHKTPEPVSKKVKAKTQGPDVYTRLIQRKLDRDERVNKEREVHRQATLKECTFTPKLQSYI